MNQVFDIVLLGLTMSCGYYLLIEMIRPNFWSTNKKFITTTVPMFLIISFFLVKYGFFDLLCKLIQS